MIGSNYVWTKKLINQHGEEDLLTCIILAYNQKDYLFDCISSVLSQNYEKIGIIVSDDGSVNFDKKRVLQYHRSKQR